MRLFNKILIVAIYMLVVAILARLGTFGALWQLLMMRTSDGATYLQAIIMSAMLIGAMLMFVVTVREGLEEKE